MTITLRYFRTEQLQQFAQQNAPVPVNLLGSGLHANDKPAARPIPPQLAPDQSAARQRPVRAPVLERNRRRRGEVHPRPVQTQQPIGRRLHQHPLQTQRLAGQEGVDLLYVF